MIDKFKDLFSDGSAAYRLYRPGYPDALFSYLSSISAENDRAWDCGAGSGQSAIALSKYYAEVIATDASENQLENATRKEGVIYRAEPAENTSLDSESVDLVTVAQALHWFDIGKFSTEVKRVLKPGGILAVWAYGLLGINPGINGVIGDLYGPVLGGYWSPERKMVEEGYKSIKFPLHEMEAPSFFMEIKWGLPQLVGYLRTWSAVNKFESERGVNPVALKYEELSQLWGDPDCERTVRWPVTLRIWRNV